MASAPPWNHNTHYFPFIHRVAADKPRRNALDIGSGDGMFAHELSQGIRSVVGLDSDAEQVRIASGRYADATNLTFELGDALTAEPSGAPFDLVTSSATIHHMPLEPALSRMKQLVAPGGTLVVVGLARESTPGDFLYSALGIVPSRIARARRGWYDHGAPMRDPDDTFSVVRDSARRVLPGVKYRKHLYWRYSLVWEKPTSA